MNQGNGAGVRLHAHYLAKTHQGFFSELSRMLGLNDSTFFIDVSPSKKGADDINKMGFKLTLDSATAEMIGLDTLLMGQYCPFVSSPNNVRMRATGARGITRLHQALVPIFRNASTTEETTFEFPKGRYI